MTTKRAETSRTFGRFLLVGLLNTAFGYAVYALLLWLGLAPQPALVISFAIGVAWNYFTTARLVFRTKGFGKLPAYVAAYMTVYAANAAALQLAISGGADPFLAQAVLTPFAAILAFALLSRVFRHGQTA